MTGRTPADVPARAPRFFDSFHLPTSNNAAVNRAIARDAAYTTADRLTKALAALRGGEQDLDLNRDAYRRSAARTRTALAELDRFLAAASPVPLTPAP